MALFGGKSGSKRQLNEITIEELHSDDDDSTQKFSISSEKAIITFPSDNDSENQTFSFPRVEYGGLEGMHHTSFMGRGKTSDGGHTPTTKHSPGGKLDTLLDPVEDLIAFVEEAGRSCTDLDEIFKLFADAEAGCGEFGGGFEPWEWKGVMPDTTLSSEQKAKKPRC